MKETNDILHEVLSLVKESSTVPSDHSQRHGPERETALNRNTLNQGSPKVLKCLKALDLDWVIFKALKADNQ